MKFKFPLAGFGHRQKPAYKSLGRAFGINFTSIEGLALLTLPEWTSALANQYAFKINGPSKRTRAEWDLLIVQLQRYSG